MPTPRRLPLLMIVGAFGLVGALGAQAVDPQALGPKVGDRVPDFSLPDQNGVRRSLQSALGPKGAVLVFYRSADW
jgi:hypothetical protein